MWPLDNLLQFILPLSCLHCDIPLKGKEKQFCHHCAQQLELAPPDSRSPPGLDSVLGPGHAAIAFESVGPGAQLSSILHHRPSLVRGCAGYLAVQFLALDWPQPDWVIPLSQADRTWWQPKTDTVSLLAKALATLISCQMLGVMRYSLRTSKPSWKPKRKIEGCRVLLVSTLLPKADVLKLVLPNLTTHGVKEIYVLSLRHDR